MIDSVGNPFPRRGFLGRLALLATPFVAGHPSAVLGQSPARPAGGPQQADWLERITGKHRTVFDVEAHRNGNALAQAASFLDAWHEAGVPDGEVNLVMGVRGSGLPLVLRDDLWRRFPIGSQYAITDPRTKQPADRNLFIDASVRPGGPMNARQTVETLQKRGALFLTCMNTIKGASRHLAAAGLGSPDEISATLRDGVLPGVIVVPAMVVAFTLMQERGISYVYAG